MLTASAVSGLVLVAAFTLYVLARHASRGIEPTIRAFDELRTALRPAVSQLRTETDALRGRLPPVHGPSAHGGRR